MTSGLYFKYNAMALPVATVFWGELFKDVWKKHRNKFHIYSVVVLLINFIYYINRLNFKI